MRRLGLGFRVQGLGWFLGLGPFGEILLGVSVPRACRVCIVSKVLKVFFVFEFGATGICRLAF